MAEHHAVSAEPLIPMPALTPATLRAALAQIAPAQLPTFAEHLEEAAGQAATQSTITPLRAFLQYWGEYVAIQRYPQQAARLRRLEAAADEADDVTALNSIVAEIQQILRWAEREATA